MTFILKITKLDFVAAGGIRVSQTHLFYYYLFSFFVRGGGRGLLKLWIRRSNVLKGPREKRPLQGPLFVNLLIIITHDIICCVSFRIEITSGREQSTERANNL